ncbi:sigma-54-dependent Fis family transcriptional regulator, partial [Caenispirillum bisanense]|uniref:sigma-54-dependent Fis family transcriptional regulator n=1 Tax=Caenispirillum bisanense TaxID=414052 RepID=UPI0031D660A7
APRAAVGGGPRRSATGAAARPADALAALDTGDARMAQLIARARKVADKPIPLLLHGESGAGKEVLARAIHASGPRRAGRFVAINCAALPEHLIEAELFGYAPGAFTGARRDGSPGRIREARGGTLFLDEIADMPLPLQARLLRVLQDGEVSPLGGGKPEAVDFALMAACHRPLKAEVEAGRFRADLYYRINGLTLTLPALRERSDAALLIRRLLDDIAPGGGVVLAPAVAEAFAAHRWPGNLRQLSHALRAAWALLDPGETVIDWHHLPEDLADDLRCRPPLHPVTVPLPLPLSGAAAADGAGDDAGLSLRRVSDSFIRQTVAASGGNMSEAARRLGISRNTLYRRLHGTRH